MPKHLRVRVVDLDGSRAEVNVKIPKPYRTKHEPESAAEVYAAGYADGQADTL